MADGSRIYLTTTGDCSKTMPTVGDGGGGGGGGGTYGGTGDSGDGGNGGWGGSGHGSGNAPNAPTSIIVKPSVQDNPKANCVLTKLLDNGQFKELLQKFQSSTKYSVSFNMGTITSGATGNCTWNSTTSTATILIDQSKFGMQHAIWGATHSFTKLIMRNYSNLLLPPLVRL